MKASEWTPWRSSGGFMGLATATFLFSFSFMAYVLFLFHFIVSIVFLRKFAEDYKVDQDKGLIAFVVMTINGLLAGVMLRAILGM